MYKLEIGNFENFKWIMAGDYHKRAWSWKERSFISGEAN